MQSKAVPCIEFLEVMGLRKSYCSLLLSMLGMLILILDGKTALSGAREGISLCIQTVIPSLFPFFVLSTMVTGGIVGQNLRLLSPIGKLLRIPTGSESLWLIGLLGGYPVGAKMIRSANIEGDLSDQNFRRMMAFCSNSGPAFIFGIGSHLFTNPRLCWLIWLIHVVSAAIVAVLTPGGDTIPMKPRGQRAVRFADALESSIYTMALVCGWVVLFRILIAFIQFRCPETLPESGSLLLFGFLELTNGCMQLYSVPDEALRFVLFSMFLGFGGMCVAMQTWSLCDGRHMDMYLRGKLLQGILSGLMTVTFISQKMRTGSILFLVLVCTGYYFFARFSQNRLDFSHCLVYNKRKIH